MKQVVEMALSEKHNEGIVFENCIGVVVNDILPDDNTNKVFNEIDCNIAGAE